MEGDVKTLPELITIFRSILPDMQKIVDRIMKENPDTTIVHSNGLISYNIDKIVAIAMLDFLPYAFGENTRGYIKRPSQN